MPSVVLFASSGAWLTTDGTMPAITPARIPIESTRVMPAAAAGGIPRLIMPRVGGHMTVATTIARATGRMMTQSFSISQPKIQAPSEIDANTNDHFASHIPPCPMISPRSRLRTPADVPLSCSLTDRPFRRRRDLLADVRIR